MMCGYVTWVFKLFRNGIQNMMKNAKRSRTKMMRRSNWMFCMLSMSEVIMFCWYTIMNCTAGWTYL